MATCGYVTHEKGASKVRGFASLDKAVEHAKKQTRQTAVVSICHGQARVIARCSNGGCGGKTNGLGRTRARKRKKRARARAK